MVVNSWILGRLSNIMLTKPLIIFIANFIYFFFGKTSVSLPRTLQYVFLMAHFEALLVQIKLEFYSTLAVSSFIPELVTLF